MGTPFPLKLPVFLSTFGDILQTASSDISKGHALMELCYWNNASFNSNEHAVEPAVTQKCSHIMKYRHDSHSSPSLPGFEQCPSQTRAACESQPDCTRLILLSLQIFHMTDFTSPSPLLPFKYFLSQGWFICGAATLSADRSASPRQLPVRSPSSWAN